MDVVFLSTLATPLILLWGIRFAGKGDFTRHRAVQTTLLCVLLVAVVLFELDVRVSGSSGSLMKGSSYAGTGWLRGILLAHVLANVATFFAWMVLVVRSWRRFEGTLPGTFSAGHRRVGRFVFGGTVFGAVSAVAMYVLGFVL